MNISIRLKMTSPCLACLIGAALGAGTLQGQDAGEGKQAPQPKDPIAAVAPTAALLEAEVRVARERAKLLHDVYAITLDAIHHHYFRREGTVVPARAMEEIFEGMAGTAGIMANWISVNTKAMSIDHEPRTQFEKTAAAELSAGKKEYELIGKHFYRRAAPIPLGTNCIGCHSGMFSAPGKSPSCAGLVISIPLTGVNN